jgi:hypothetical protein
MLEAVVRVFRHAGLLLLLLLLAGGPALRAVVQLSCTPQRSRCPMCEHRMERMPCMGGHNVHAQVSAEVDPLDAVVDASSDCFCGQIPASQVDQTQVTPSLRVDQAPVLPVAVEPAWPSVRQLAGRSLAASASAGMPVLRSHVAAPLRV